MSILADCMTTAHRGGNVLWTDARGWFLSVVWEDCPGLGHEPGIQCRFLCLLSNSYIVCWVSSCLEIQGGGVSTLFFFLFGQVTSLISKEDGAFGVHFLPPSLFSHKGSSWCQLELGARADLKLVKKKVVHGIEVFRHLSMGSSWAETNTCCLCNR